MTLQKTHYHKTSIFQIRIIAQPLCLKSKIEAVIPNEATVFHRGEMVNFSH